MLFDKNGDFLLEIAVMSDASYTRIYKAYARLREEGYTDEEIIPMLKGKFLNPMFGGNNE